MRFVNSMRWLGAVAALGAAPMALAQPGDADPKDVTITVVSDPDQLNEKVNRIPLPAAGDEQSQASNKHVREVDRGKEADNSHEPAASDADGAKHDLGDLWVANSQSSGHRSLKQTATMMPPGVANK